jgi:GT2 family glycosyltransferase
VSSIYPLYVVIPNWNLCADTIKCVRSVFEAGRGLDVSVVVADNGSTDGSPEALRRAFGERVHQVLMGRNTGFAGAVNAGMRYAFERGAGSALVLNNDTVIDPQMLRLLGEAAEEHPDAGIVGPAIFYIEPPDRIWRLGDRDYAWLPIPLRIADREARQPVVEMGYATGCGMLVRREVVEAIGYLDDVYFMYYEDADFSRRARERGFRILCVPQAKMWHRVSATARQDGVRQVYWRSRSQAIFYRKHARGGLKPLAHLFVAGKTALAWAQFALHGQRDHTRSLMAGTLAGYGIRLDGGGGHA